MLKIAVVGCGKIGEIRAKNILSKDRILGFYDVDIDKSKELQKSFKNSVIYESIDDILKSNVNTVFIATIHSELFKIASKFIRAGINILIEKPASISTKEIKELIALQKRSKSIIHVGFNHRFHKSVIKAKKIIDSGHIGKTMFLRARYGHGGRVGYEKEWRANKKLSGGGELIDQGSHLIDLSRFFLGEFAKVYGICKNFFWNMNVEDNAFLTLETKTGLVAHLHASCTEWKNKFNVEIYGEKGKIELDGLGKSYGTEKIILYKMLPQMGPPKTYSWEFPMEDDSWLIQYKEFRRNILHKSESLGLKDAYANIDIIEKVYKDYYK